ncbi:hypothetical protein LEL_07032 [Akanthomyces lecanii RCEF 1005]|uniref:Uncharacterized protein n=1 Tax=Akanthomyces lecanii RCEF 1005 TaxID=1081108 RepID=A0A162LSJ5_CORDF|nr:hypothetical protein LEL_07032 [Akanthomyces lecanii RCEF 1005]
MPPYSPDKPFHDLLPFSPSTPASASPGSTPKEKPLPPGAVIRYLWTCHQCGCGTFCCDDASVALCVQCEHEICSGCTTSFGSRLLRGVEVEDLPKHAPNPGCTCERPSKINRCRTGHPIRRCPGPGVRRLRHAPYARPTSVQHCIVTFRPGRDGRPALGTFFVARPRFETSRSRARARDASTGDETLDCIASSVAAARPVTTIPPIYDMLRQPRPGDPVVARRGIPVSTVALARFFATGASSVARALGMSGPVVCVHVDPMLAFVAYYLCASFYAVFAEWKERIARQLLRAPRE